MNLDSILNKYKDHHWVEEEASASVHVMGPWRICYLDWINIFKNKNLYSFCFFLLNKNHLYEWSSYEESVRVLRWLLKIYDKNKQYLINKDKEYQQVSKEIDDLFYFFREVNVNTFTDRELKKHLIKLMDIGNISFGYNLLAEAMDIVDEDYYQRLLPKASEVKLLDIVSLLSTPDCLSFLEREHLDLLWIAKKYFKNNKLKKDVGFYADLKAHQQNYFWIQNNYKEAKQVKVDDFLQSLQEVFKTKTLKEVNKEMHYLENKSRILVAKRKIAYKKYRVSKKTKDFFALVRLLSTWQDRRKESVQKILASVDKIFGRISKEHQINKQTLKEYFPEELSRLIIQGKKVTNNNLEKRKKILFYSYLDKFGRIKKEIFYGPQVFAAKKYFQRYNAIAKDGNLKGFVASRGKNQDIISGKVRVVLHAKGARLKVGEILVTGMTRPEFVPLMKRAKAIITNEGGITTHAAIVSRELKKPCIIGTKIATQVLKNGDRIQLNLQTGLIEKL